jgi:hypothetical protein
MLVVSQYLRLVNFERFLGERSIVLASIKMCRRMDIILPQKIYKNNFSKYLLLTLLSFISITNSKPYIWLSINPSKEQLTAHAFRRL